MSYIIAYLYSSYLYLSLNIIITQHFTRYNYSSTTYARPPITSRF